MAPNIRYPDRDQGFLLPPSIRDWLPEGHFAWFVIDAVERMDLSAFSGKVRRDGKGGAWYSPKMMATLLLYSYANGTRSSRRIEALCEVDVAFRVICGNLRPDHCSIARFRQSHEKAFKDLFVSVLELCREAGLTRAGILALDGTKIAGNASLAANRTEETLRAEIEKMVAEAKARDAEEDGLYGNARGDELPPDVRTSKGRLKRLEECLQSIKARKETEAAEREALLRRRQEREASGKMIRGRKPILAPENKEPKANVTDPESRIMKTAKGFLQGFNAQAVANEHQIIVASEVTQDQNDTQQLHPMVEKAVENLKEAGETDLPTVVTADAGYPSESALSQPLSGGVEPFCATRKSHVERANNTPAPKGRIPKKATAMERMGRKLRTKRGRALYKQRSQIIEPVFGQIKTGLQQVDRFSRRGKDACDSEWKLICAVHNLRKLWNLASRGKKDDRTVH